MYYKGVEIVEGHLMIGHVHMPGIDTARTPRIGIYGIFKREKCTTNI